MWPQRWFTPVTGRDQAAARPAATPTPTSRHPARPGPRVTAMSSIPVGFAPAPSRARSRRCGSRSRWSRAASSGTTPPNSAWSSTCEWMTLARTRRPPATTATEVSSQLVSMARVSPKGEDLLLIGVLADKLAAQASHVGFDAFQVGLVGATEAGRMDRVRPHHDRVLAVVRVVALAAPDDLEAEGFVHMHGVLIGSAHLEGHPLRAHVIGRLHETREQDAPVAAMLDVTANADRRDVQHRGHGRILFAGLVQAAYDMGAKWVTLEVRTSNENAMHMYLSLIHISEP